MRKGFTLVELSIVLVIIGLLIGGILVAQSLIDSAKIQKFVREQEQYIVAINAFKSRFRQLPGDSEFFTTPGDNNGKIAYPGGGATGEWTRAWAHLSEANILPKSYSGVQPATAGNAGVPESEVFEKGYYTISGNALPHHIRVGHQDNAGAMNSGGVFPPIHAMAIDKKLDDGLADSGDVRPVLFSAFEPNCVTNTTGGGAPYTSGDYNVTNEDGRCSLRSYLDF